MVDNPFVAARKSHKNELLHWINTKKDVPRPQLLALYSQNKGLRLAKINEYVTELEQAGLIDPEQQTKL